MAISTMLILPIHTHGRSFYPLMSFSISLFMDGFHWKSLWFPSLNLFLGILFFEAIANGIVSLISFLVCSLFLYIKKFCILLLCQKSLQFLRGFWWSLWGPLGIGSYYLLITIVWFLPSLFESLLFLALVLLLWLGIPALYWLTVWKMSIPVSFLTLVEMVSLINIDAKILN
jgi:hypothetical protein